MYNPKHIMRYGYDNDKNLVIFLNEDERKGRDPDLMTALEIEEAWGKVVPAAPGYFALRGVGGDGVSVPDQWDIFPVVAWKVSREATRAVVLQDTDVSRDAPIMLPDGRIFHFNAVGLGDWSTSIEEFNSKTIKDGKFTDSKNWAF